MSNKDFKGNFKGDTLSYTALVNSNDSAWRKERLSASQGRKANGKLWEEYQEEMERTAKKKRETLSQKLAKSQAAGISDEQARKNKKKFKLKRVVGSHENNGQRVFEYKEITQPEVDLSKIKTGKRNEHKAIRPHLKRETPHKYTELNIGELADIMIGKQNARLEKYDEEALLHEKAYHEKRAETLLSRHMKEIQGALDYHNQRAEYITSLLPEVSNEEEVTVSEPRGIMVTMRGWLRGVAQKAIQLLQKI